MKTEEPSLEDKQRLILTWLAVDLGEDREFLSRVNKLTFGLLKENHIY